MGRLQGRGGKQNAVVGDDAHGHAVDMREGADDGFAVQALELVEPRAVDDARDDLAHVIGHARVGGDDAVDLGRVVGRVFRCGELHAVDGGRAVEVRHGGARDLQRMAVAFGVMVGDAGLAAMHVGAAQIFRRHFLARRGLHQRRAAQEDRALALDDDAFVAHGGHVGAARRARPHDHGDLRDVGRRHVGLVEEDAPEMVAVGEHLVLVGQVGAAGIDQIDAGEMVLHGDFLGPQVLLHGDGVVRSALHRGVVAHDHAVRARHAADPGDHAGPRHLAAVHVPGRELADLEERGARIEQALHPVAGQQFAAHHMTVAGLLAAALFHDGAVVRQRRDQAVHAFPVFLEGRVAGVDPGFELGHQAVSWNSSRPISMRRISDVPAPISYSLASRSRRPVGLSLMYPMPPSACTACSATCVAFSAA